MSEFRSLWVNVKDVLKMYILIREVWEWDYRKISGEKGII